MYNEVHLMYAGGMASAASGISMELLFERYIFEPAGMTSTVSTHYSLTTALLLFCLVPQRNFCVRPVRASAMYLRGHRSDGAPQTVGRCSALD